MSSDSSESILLTDSEDEDGTLLEASELRPSQLHNLEASPPEISSRQQRQTIRDVCLYLQSIYDSIQSLHQKFNLLYEKVSQIHRSLLKPRRITYKSLGSLHKTVGPPLPRRIRYHRGQKKKGHSGYSHSLRGNSTPLVVPPDAEANSEAAPVETSSLAPGAPQQK